MGRDGDDKVQKKHKDSIPMDQNPEKEKPLEEEEEKVEIKSSTHKKLEEPKIDTLESTSKAGEDPHSLIPFSKAL